MQAKKEARISPGLKASDRTVEVRTLFEWSRFCPGAKDVGQIEAVADADGHDEWVDGDIGLGGGTLPGGVGIEPDFLDVGVEVPTFANFDIDASL